MKKRFLSFLLALIMVISLLPTAVFADVEPVAPLDDGLELPFKPSRNTSDELLYSFTRRNSKNIKVGDALAWITSDITEDEFINLGIPVNSGLVRVVDKNDWEAYCANEVDYYLNVIEAGRGFDGCEHGTLNFDCTEYNCWRGGVRHLKGSAYDYFGKPYYSTVRFSLYENGVPVERKVGLYDGHEVYLLTYKGNGLYESNTVYVGDYIICIYDDETAKYKLTNQGVQVNNRDLSKGYYVNIVEGEFVQTEDSVHADAFYSSYTYSVKRYVYDYKASIYYNGELSDSLGELSLVASGKAYGLTKTGVGYYEGTIVFPNYIDSKETEIFFADNRTGIHFQTRREANEEYTNKKIKIEYYDETLTLKKDDAAFPGILVGFDNGVNQYYDKTDDNGVISMPIKLNRDAGGELPYKVTVYGVVDNLEPVSISSTANNAVIDYYTVSFITDDAEHPYRTQYVRKDSTPNGVASAPLEGLSFNCWSQDIWEKEEGIDSVTKFDFDQPITTASSVYAHYTKPSVNIYDVYVGTNTFGAIVTDGSATAFRLPAVAISGFAPEKVIQSCNLDMKNVEKVYFYNAENVEIKQEGGTDPTASENNGFYTTGKKVTVSFKNKVTMAEAENFIRNNVVLVPVSDQTSDIKLTVSDENISVADNSVIEQTPTAIEWIKLSELSDNKLIGKEKPGYYYVDDNITMGSISSGKNGLVVDGVVHLYIPKDYTLTAIGADANDEAGKSNPGMAGIKLPLGSSLYLYGEGTLSAKGGKAGDGQNGQDAYWVKNDQDGYGKDTPRGGLGGHGGYGGGAGIGTDGANYGELISFTNYQDQFYDRQPTIDNCENHPYYGNNRDSVKAEEMGQLYIANTLNVISQGGIGGGDGQNGGKKCEASDYYQPSGGGGAGFGGHAGADVGLGGYSGASGGSGAPGKLNYGGWYPGNGGEGANGANGANGDPNPNITSYFPGGPVGTDYNGSPISVTPKVLSEDQSVKYTVTFKDEDLDKTYASYPYYLDGGEIPVPDYPDEIQPDEQFAGWKVKTYGKTFGIAGSDYPLTTAEAVTYAPETTINIEAGTYGDIVLVPVIAPLPGNFAFDMISLASIDTPDLYTYTLNVTKNGTPADLGTIVFKDNNGKSYNVNSAVGLAGTYTLSLTDDITITQITLDGAVVTTKDNKNIPSNGSAEAAFKSMEVAVTGKDVGTVVASGASVELLYDGTLSSADTAVFAVLTQAAVTGDTLYTILVDGEEIPAGIAQAKWGTRAVVNYSTVNVDVTTNVTEPLTVLLKAENKNDILLVKDSAGKYSAAVLSDNNTDYSLYINDTNTGKTVKLNSTAVAQSAEYYEVVIVSKVDGVVKKTNQTIKVNNAPAFTFNNVTFTAIALSDNECTITSNGTKAAIVAPSTTLGTTYIDYYTVTYTPGAFCTGTAPVDRTLYLNGQNVVLKDFDGLTADSNYFISAWNDGSDDYSSGSALTVNGTTTFTSVATPDNVIVHYVDHYGEVGTVSRLPITQKIVVEEWPGLKPSFTDGILNYRFKGWTFSADTDSKTVYSIYDKTEYTPKELIVGSSVPKHVTFSAVYDIEYTKNITLEPSLHDAQGKTVQSLYEENQIFAIDYTITENDGINKLVLIPEYDTNVFEIVSITPNNTTGLGEATPEGNSKISFSNEDVYSETGVTIASITYKVKTLSPGGYTFGFKLNYAEDTLDDITFNDRSYAYLSSPRAIGGPLDPMWEVKIDTDDSRIKAVIAGSATITIPADQSVVYSGNKVSGGHKYLFGNNELYKENTTNDILFEYSGYEKQHECAADDQVKFTINWYDKDNNLLSEAPVNAGTYFIGVSASACLYYGEVPEERETFTITKAHVSAPAISECCEIDYDLGKITVKEGYEVSTNSGSSFSAETLDDNRQRSITPDTVYYFRKAEDENHFASDCVSSDTKFNVSLFEVADPPQYPCQKKYGEKISSKPTKPEKDGFVFGGWYIDAGCTQAWNFGADTVRDNMVLYPKWIRGEAASSILGGVVNQDGTAVSGAAVELRLGIKKVAATVTDSEGNYLFDNVEKGTYDVVASKDGKIKTALVKVTEVNNYEANITLPAGKVNSNVEFEGDVVPESKSDINSTVVGGLDEIAEGISAGSDKITIKFKVEPKEDTATPEQTAIKQLAGNGTKVEFLDLSLWKQINEGDPQNIGSDNEQLLTIVIPFDFTGVDVKSVMILRHHGNSEKLSKNPAAGQEGYVVDVNAGTITVYAKRFSDYALGYKLVSSTPSSGSGSSNGLYSITINSTLNGTVEVNKQTAHEGDKITVTLNPDNGFGAGGIVVISANGSKISVEDNGNGQYSFVMPKTSVTVNASFVFVSSVHDCPRDYTCPIDPFGDTENDRWWHDGIHYCIENGLMEGYGNNIFGPTRDTTRAMMTTMLWRLSGSPESDYQYTFKDVPAGQWYTEAVKWAKENGVVQGYNEESFGPNDVITREQMMTIFCRYYAFRGNQLKIEYDFSRFKDASKVSAYAIDGVKWSVNNCVIQGDGDYLNPKASCTRAQAANIVRRFCEMFGFLNK